MNQTSTHRPPSRPSRRQLTEHEGTVVKYFFIVRQWYSFHCAAVKLVAGAAHTAAISAVAAAMNVCFIFSKEWQT